jgi:hypothetical protein
MIERTLQYPPVKSYTELHLFILDIVKLSLLALDAEQGRWHLLKPCVAIRGVLEIVLQTRSLEEAGA